MPFSLDSRVADPPFRNDGAATSPDILTKNTAKGFASREVYSLHQPVILGKGQYNPWMSSRIDDFVLLRQHEAAKI
jgi:hypothetical protein